jgi:DNA replication and repair protein RecF
VHVEALELTDFRNYRHALVELGPGCTVFVGRNGQGKTNLVEAVGYAATLRSHRVASDALLVRHGAESATIRLRARRGGRSAALDLVIAPGGRTRARLNGQHLPRVRDCLGLVRAVVFAPEDLALVKGEPAGRRDYLDDLLVQRQPRWAGVCSDVERVLRQRGALLRAVAKRGGRPDPVDRSTLLVWDEQLARAGGELQAGRQALVDALRPIFIERYRDLAGSAAAADLRYRPSTSLAGPDGPHDWPAALAAALPQRQDEEFRRGVNLTGPHRDEVEILLSGHPAKGYASHGESWSLALALRLAAYRLLAQEAVDDGDPVLILDDVFAELDDSRRARLASAVSTAEQVLITAAVAQDVPQMLGGRRIPVAGGALGAAQEDGHAGG